MFWSSDTRKLRQMPVIERQNALHLRQRRAEILRHPLRAFLDVVDRAIRPDTGVLKDGDTRQAARHGLDQRAIFPFKRRLPWRQRVGTDAGRGARNGM